MTVDDIKQQYSMADVAGMYGFHPNRAGFISCPFHTGDRSPSMKIYKKDYHCHACNANGDIFSFVQGMENCSFKDAFLKLGGTYEQKSSWQHKRFEYELQKKKEREKKELIQKKAYKKSLIESIRITKMEMQLYAVFSDKWCEAVNRFELEMYHLNILQQEGVRLYD